MTRETSDSSLTNRDNAPTDSGLSSHPQLLAILAGRSESVSLSTAQKTTSIDGQAQAAGADASKTYGNNRDLVQHFFENYGLLASPDPNAFQKAQSALLTPDLQTDVISFGQTKSYVGREGYFKSLQDWSQMFRTGPDFKVAVDAAPDSHGAYEAHLTGTIMVTKDGTTFSVPPDKHHWTESFAIGPDNQIKHLTVDMGIEPQS